MPELPDHSFSSKGGRWVIAQLVLMLGVLAAGPLSERSGGSILALLGGWLLILAGAVLGIAGVRGLGRNRTAFPRPLPEGDLVQSGIFHFVRHPLYASVIFLSFGWTLVWHSIAALVLAVLLTMLLHCKALREERWLREKYPAYADYASRVKRYIPWVF